MPEDTLAHRLMLIRDELGWSQRVAAEICGISFGEWQSMENGARARGLDEKVARIAAGSGYDPIWIMWGGPLRAPEPSPSPTRSSSRLGESNPGPIHYECNERRHETILAGNAQLSSAA